MTVYNATAEFTGKDQNWQDETTIYWFSVESMDYRIESGGYGIADNSGTLTPVNSDGSPIDYNEHEAVAVLSLCQINDDMVMA